MTPSLALVAVVLVAALAIAVVLGRLTRRTGRLRPVAAADDAVAVDTTGLDLSTSGPTLLHVGAPWCGPCAGVRRVAAQVCADLPGVAHREIDLDAHPEVGRRLSVLSLPTTFVFDSAGRQRFRAGGVPTAADLRAAIEPLLA